MGSFLLDTHALIWYLEGNENPSEKARAIIRSKENQVFVSIGSFWEMAIKLSIGKLILPEPLPIVINKVFLLDITPLPITTEHIITVQTLPFFHRDPFDRLLISQARTENLSIISRDPHFDQYEILKVW